MTIATTTMKQPRLAMGALVLVGSTLTGCVAVPEENVATLPSGTSTRPASNSLSAPLLEAHNRYRLEVGVPQLTWSESLATASQTWADRLATSNTFEHSQANGYGENLWQGTAGAFSLTEMVATWGDEQADFMPNRPFPDVSTTGNWADVGHYTQMIWRDTTEVGCGLATANGYDVLVCRYTPPGNYQGEVPF